MFIFTLLNVLFLPILSLKPKLCINCKYFIKDYLSNDKFGKCSLFPKKENDIYMLVSGIPEDKNLEYHYCSVSREIVNMCGKEGKLYKKKYTKRNL